MVKERFDHSLEDGWQQLHLGLEYREHLHGVLCLGIEAEGTR